MNGMKTEGTLALATIEMNVLIVERALIMSGTSLVFCYARSVFYCMYEVVG